VVKLPNEPRERWLFALKPASWPKLLVPALFGQSLGAAAAGSFSAGAAAFGVAFTVFDIAYIVLLNDWADREVDAIKRRRFPHAGSAKTIPDGILPASRVLAAGVLAGISAIGTSLFAAVLLSRPWLAAGGLLSVGIFAFYSLPPVRLNYRGGGELLEMLGVGAVLPWLNAYAVSGRMLTPELSLLIGFLPLCLASAIASGLSDEESDRAGGKRTFVTSFGNRAARRTVERLVLVAALAWPLGSLAVSGIPSLWATGASSLLLLHFLRRVVSVSQAATSGAFVAQGVYKRELHRAIWGGATLLATITLARSLLA
jgi:4-hydroxybenzoate polyprenyltransferase